MVLSIWLIISLVGVVSLSKSDNGDPFVMSGVMITIVNVVNILFTISVFQSI